MSLAESLQRVAIVDHHAHPLLREAMVDARPYASFFTEAYDPALVAEHGPRTFFYQRAIRELAGFWGCAPTVEALRRVRQEVGHVAWIRQLLAAANLEAVLLDDGFLADESEPLPWHAQFDWRVERVVRAEHELERLFPESRSAHDLLDRFAVRLAEVASEPTVRAFKSIIAYRGGLSIQHWSQADVERSYDETRRTWGERTPRLEAKPLLDAAFVRLLEVVRERPLPLQVHTGFGDPDLDLRESTPLHLRPFFEERAFRQIGFVLLHSYPYTREAGYLAASYPNVFADISLTIPFASRHGQRAALHELLYLAPVTKVLFGTDASRVPELFWLGATAGRRVVAEVLEETVASGDLTSSEAEEAGRLILAENARRLYGILPLTPERRADRPQAGTQT